MDMELSKVSRFAIVFLALAQVASLQPVGAADIRRVSSTRTRTAFLKMIDHPRMPLATEVKAILAQDGLAQSPYALHQLYAGM
jgi:hypothetical protein